MDDAAKFKYHLSEQLKQKKEQMDQVRNLKSTRVYMMREQLRKSMEKRKGWLDMKK